MSGIGYLTQEQVLERLGIFDTIAQIQADNIALQGVMSSALTTGSVIKDTTISDLAAAGVFTAITDELVITVGSSGTVLLSSDLAVAVPSLASPMTANVVTQWKWFNGTTYEDIGLPSNSSPRVERDSSGVVTPGRNVTSASKTGLAEGASEKFLLFAYKNDPETFSFTGYARAQTDGPSA